MRPEKKILISRDLWKTAWATMRATRKQMVLLIALGLILPQVLVNLSLDVKSSAVVSELRAIFTSKVASTGSAVAFTDLVAPMLTFLTPVAMCILLLTLVFLASFLALVHTAVDHHRGIEARGPLTVWLAGLRSTLPLAVILGLLLVVVVVAGQVLIAPALTVAVLSLVIPIELVAERRGIFPTLWSALTMRYTRGSGYSGWTVFFNLISLSAFFYAALATAGLLSEWLLLLDEHLQLPRGVWTYTIGNADFGPVHVAVAVLEACISMSLLAALPALTASLYFTVRTGQGGRVLSVA